MDDNKNISELREKFSHIPGWGHDIDPDNEPTYPYKTYTGDDHKRLNWERPPQQEKTVEILQSTEHLRTPSVFGTKEPPSGVSGAIRRQAFQYSEGMLRHWLMLIFADRVDVVEGLLSDFKKGTIPNWWKERGFDAMWEHNKKLMAKRALIRGALYGLVLGLFTYALVSGDDEKIKKQRLHPETA